MSHATTVQSSRVSVNQRALIDKILARYSSEYAVYRELIQNSADADATMAEIHFVTKDSGRREVVYKNNGIPFRPQDWDRLKTVAAGNPDPSKVGAFGVGAYAMFSICEEPMVISGDKALLFQWKGDHLWTQTMQNPSVGQQGQGGDDTENWTTFVMPQRDSQAENPVSSSKGVVDFGKFLVTSLTFTSLKEIKVFVGEKMSMRFAKEEQDTKVDSIMNHDEYDFETQTPKGYFVISDSKKDLQKQLYQMTVEIDGTTSSAFAHYVTANLKTSIPESVSSQMERVTKKAPPANVVVKVLQTETITADGAGTNKNSQAHKVTRHFVTSATGRIFIGFKTSQTTGLGAHVAAPFVPTVEREAMDLQDPHLKLYNTELLEASGMLLRRALEQRMVELEAPFMGEHLEAMDTNVNQILSPTERKAVLLMKSFCPRASTPQSFVGKTLWRGFQRGLAGRTPSVLTLNGILAGNQGPKLPYLSIERFCKSDVVPENLYANAQEYHERVAMCPRLTVEDMERAIVSTTLSQNELVYLLRSWCRHHRNALTVSLSSAIKKVRFFRNDDDVRCLGDYNLYLPWQVDLSDESRPSDSCREWDNLPLPSGVIPEDLQERIGIDMLNLLGFQEMTVEGWLTFICLTHRSLLDDAETKDPNMLQTRLSVMKQLSMEYRRQAMTRGTRNVFGAYCQKYLKDLHCVPCDDEEGDGSQRFEKPSTLFAYNSNVDKLGVAGLRKCSSKLEGAGISEDFLIAIGVRKAATASVLLEHLQKGEQRDDPKTIVEYLQSLPLTDRDRQTIGIMPCFPAAGINGALFAANELCLPNRRLRFLFPAVKQLRWPHDEDLSETEGCGQFLASLGMQSLPENLFGMLKQTTTISSMDERCIRLDFIARLLKTKKISPLARKLKIIPVTQQYVLTGVKKNLFCSPLDCYSDPRCAVMGFPVVDQNLENSALYAERFECATEPSWASKMRALEVLTKNAQEVTLNAQGKSSDYQAQLCTSLEQAFDSMYRYLSDSPQPCDAWNIRVPCKDGQHLVWKHPSQVFFESSANDPHAKALFHFKEGNRFLETLGVRREPPMRDFLLRITMSPETVLKLLGSEEGYRSLLRRIAISETRVPGMRDKAFLLAYCSGSSADELKDDSGGENSRPVRCAFAKAKDIVVVDNAFLAGLFPIYRAPFDQTLEDFYLSLGSIPLSEMVKKRYQWDEAASDTPSTMELRKAILDRTSLLVAPSRSNRPVKSNAAAVMNALEIRQVPKIDVTYSLGHLSTLKTTTCCLKPTGRLQKLMLITEDFDWFDVGMVLGSLLLQRCHLEDGLLFSTLLQTPVSVLEARGFQMKQVHVDAPVTVSDILDDTTIDMDDPDPSAIFHVPGVSAIFSTAKSAATQIAATTTGRGGQGVSDTVMGFFRSAGRKINDASLAEPLLEVAAGTDEDVTNVVPSDVPKSPDPLDPPSIADDGAEAAKVQEEAPPEETDTSSEMIASGENAPNNVTPSTTEADDFEDVDVEDTPVEPRGPDDPSLEHSNIHREESTADDVAGEEEEKGNDDNDDYGNEGDINITSFFNSLW